MRSWWIGAVAAVCLPAGAQDVDALLSSSRAAAGELTRQLGAELRKALGSGDPASAIAVCKTIAPDIAGKLSRQSGARIARVSLKTRNPLLGTPDAWEQAVLAEFDRRAAKEPPEALERWEIVSEPAGRYYRYMKAIPVQPLCLTCHGAAEAIPEPVKAVLRQEYPHDRATGYALGQVRGAITVKQRVGD